MKDSPPNNLPQDLPKKPRSSQRNLPQSFTRISYVENPYTFEERHAPLSETLLPAIRQAPLSELQYEPTYTVCPHYNKTLIEQVF